MTKPTDPQLSAARKTETLTVRLEPALRERVDLIRSRMPYRPTITTVIERGLVLACIELERMIEASDALDLATIHESAEV